jgi:hypothetical protein
LSARIDAETFDPARISQAVLDFNTALVGGMASSGWVFPPESAPALRCASAGTSRPR